MAARPCPGGASTKPGLCLRLQPGSSLQGAPAGPAGPAAEGRGGGLAAPMGTEITRRSPAPSFRFATAFMNGAASQTADWLSRRPQGPIRGRGALVERARGLGPRSHEWHSHSRRPPPPLRSPLPQGEEEVIFFCFFGFF